MYAQRLTVIPNRALQGVGHELNHHQEKNCLTSNIRYSHLVVVLVVTGRQCSKYLNHMFWPIFTTTPFQLRDNFKLKKKPIRIWQTPFTHRSIFLNQ